MNEIIIKNIQNNICNNLANSARLEKLDELNHKMQLVQNKFNEHKNAIDENQKSFDMILSHEKNSLTNDISTTCNLTFQKIQDQLSIIDIDPTQAEGGTLGYTARIKQVKYLVELANEIRKQFIGFVEKVVNTNM